jgi:UDP:flavonoid glycosyltransferase YjiC (YdhE family)
VVGIGFQAEQQANIDGLAKAGMGIRIPLYSVNKRRVLKAVDRICEPSFKENASKMQELVLAYDGVSESVRLMNELVTVGKPGIS